MPRATALISNFTGGELSPRINGRTDIKKYGSGLRSCRNFTVLPHGGARKRSGTKYVIQLKDTNTTRWVPFQYNTEQSYHLLFGNNYVWFFKDGGIITQTAQNITGITKANPGVVTYAGSDTYANGDRVLIQSVAGMTEVNNRWFTVANVNAGANTFELSGVNTSSYGTYTSGGTVAEIVELTTTYTAAQLADLAYTQIADTLYITHPDHPLRKISRTSHTAWTLSTPDITTGPFRTINSDRTLKITPSSFNLATVTGATQANPCVITCAGGHSFQNGVTVSFSGVVGMVNLNSGTYSVANATATTFELSATDSSGWPAYVSGGTATQNANAYGCYPVGVACTLTATSSTFTSDMVGALFRLNQEGGQSGITAPPLGDVSVSITPGTVYTFSGNVYGVSAINRAQTWRYHNRVPDHTSGTMRVINGLGDYYDSDYLHSGFCIVRITAYTSATVVTAQIVRYQMPADVVTSGTSFWEEGAWSDYRGYPRCLTNYEQRLWFAGVSGDPNVVWSTKTGIYEDFTDGTDDSDAIIYRVASGQADVIRWLSAGRVLTAGSSQGEYAFAASNQNEALTPSNVKAVLQTTFGTSTAFPIRIGQALLYPQRNGNASNAARKIREFQYEFSQDAFSSVDLTVFAEHITGDGITELAYQLEPDSIIWALRSDGTLCACTYERTQEVVAWHRHVLGGSGLVKNIGVIPGTSGDDLWMVVERTINSTTVRYVELLGQAFRDDDDKVDGIFVDASSTYSGASTTTLSGLWHLRGEAVTILNNGNHETGTISATGGLTLAVASAGGPVHVGKSFTGILETQDLEAGAAQGTAQSRARKIGKVFLRLLNSLGGEVGPDSTHLKDLIYRVPSNPLDSSPPLFSGLIGLDIESAWDDDNSRVYFQHSEPFPLHVTGVVSEINTSG